MKLQKSNFFSFIFSAITPFIKEEKKFIIVLFSFFVFECAIGWFELGMFDFTAHMAAAENIAQGKMLYRDHHGFYYGEQWVDYPYPPLYLYVVGGIFYLFGYNAYYAKVFLSFVNSINALLIYLIVKKEMKESERKNAYFASILYMLDPTTNAAVYVGNFESFALLFILTSLYFYIRKWKTSPILVGISIGLGTMVKLFPIILIIVFLLVYYKRKEDENISSKVKNIKMLFLSTSLTIIIISLPFLYACPKEYLEYTILYHFRRETTSISIAYYFFEHESMYFLPMILQISAVSALFFVKKYRDPVGMAVFAFSSFLTFSRVTYPKYWTLLSGPIWLKFFTSNDKRRYLLISSYAILLLGCGIWDIPYLSGNCDFKSDVLFFVGAGIYAIGAVMLTIFSFRAVQISNVNRSQLDTIDFK